MSPSAFPPFLRALIGRLGRAVRQHGRFFEGAEDRVHILKCPLKFCWTFSTSEDHLDVVAPDVGGQSEARTLTLETHQYL